LAVLPKFGRLRFQTVLPPFSSPQSCGTNGLNPEAYLANVLARINDHRTSRLDELLPWNWKPTRAPESQAA
jgi:hypothetical protein